MALLANLILSSRLLTAAVTDASAKFPNSQVSGQAALGITLPIMVDKSRSLRRGFWESPTRDGSFVALSLLKVLHSDPTSITRSPKNTNTNLNNLSCQDRVYLTLSKMPNSMFLFPEKSQNLGSSLSIMSQTFVLKHSFNCCASPIITL